MTHAEICPVCLGTGFVPNGFYSGMGGSTSTTPETCRSCFGKGYIVVTEEDDPIEIELTWRRTTEMAEQNRGQDD